MEVELGGSHKIAKSSSSLAPEIALEVALCATSFWRIEAD